MQKTIPSPLQNIKSNYTLRRISVLCRELIGVASTFRASSRQINQFKTLCDTFTVYCQMGWKKSKKEPEQIMTWYAACPLPCQIYGTHIQKDENVSPYHAALPGSEVCRLNDKTLQCQLLTSSWHQSQLILKWLLKGKQTRCHENKPEWFKQEYQGWYNCKWKSIFNFEKKASGNVPR